jgi:hypothetical protein
MVVITTIFGLLLILQGGVDFFGKGAQPNLATMPFCFGLGLIVCAVIGQLRPKARKHAMHAAILLAVVGCVASIGGFYRLCLSMVADQQVFLPAADFDRAWRADQARFFMCLTCLVYVAVSIGLFIRARRAGAAGEK